MKSNFAPQIVLFSFYFVANVGLMCSILSSTDVAKIPYIILYEFYCFWSVVLDLFFFCQLEECINLDASNSIDEIWLFNNAGILLDALANKAFYCVE